MRWQRRIALSVLACLLVGAAGCGGSQPPPEEPTAGFVIPPPSTQGYVPPVAEPRVVRLAVNYGARGGHAWVEGAQQEINRLLEEEGSTLRLEMICMYPGDFWYSFIIQTGDNGFDLFSGYLGGDRDRSDNVRTLAEQGLVEDITDYLADYPELYAMNPQDVWREASVDGRIYAIPLAQADATGAFSRQTRIQVKEGWLEALEAEFPRTMEELKTLLYKARDNNMPFKILASLSAPPYAFHRTYEQWPFYVDEKSRFVFYPDGSVEPYIGSDIFRQDAQNLQELQDLGLLTVNGETGTYITRYEGDRSVFAMALYPNYVQYQGEAAYNGYLEPERPIFRTEPAATYAIYIRTNREYYDGTEEGRNYADGTSSEIGEILEMLQYLYCNEEIYLAFTYGIEGEDWARLSDGVIERAVASEQQAAFTWGLSPHDPVGGKQSDAQAGPYIDFPAAGFMATYNPLFNLSELYALRRGFMPMSELDAVISRMEEKGFFDLVEMCKMKYAEYIE